MKIDYDLIASFKELGSAGSRNALANYAEENFGVKIRKNYSFERILETLEESINARPLQKSDAGIDVSTEIKEQTSSPKFVIRNAIDDELIEAFLKKDEHEAPVQNTNVLLPPDFSPCFVPMNAREPFYPLSYWIYDWIVETDNWMTRVNEYPRVQEHKFLYTLIYYIQQYGKFTIRETRNGSYVTLKS